MAEHTQPIQHADAQGGCEHRSREAEDQQQRSEVAEQDVLHHVGEEQLLGHVGQRGSDGREDDQQAEGEAEPARQSDRSAAGGQGTGPSQVGPAEQHEWNDLERQRGHAQTSRRRRRRRVSITSPR